jgi:hypothetical protein
MIKTKHLIIMSILVSAALVGIMFSFPVTAATVTPDTYKITLYKTEFSTNGATWVEVSSSLLGTQIDFQNAAQIGSVFGQSTANSIPEGTYKAVRFTIKNAIEYSYAAGGIGATTFSPYAGASTEQLPVYFAVSGTFSWSNDGSTLLKAFPMPYPIRVVADGTSRIILNFGVTNSLSDSGGWHLAPPTISVSNIVIPPTPPANPNLFAGGEYYFVRQNLVAPASVNDMITPTWVSISSGWGIISMSVPSAQGVGTFEVQAGSNNEHRMDIGNNGLFYNNQIDSGNTMTGTYYADADGFINMLMPRSGIIRGGVRGDGKVFIAIEVAPPSSQTADTQVGYHMIYALKKITETAGTMVGNYAFNGYQSEVFTATQAANPSPGYYYVENASSIGWLNAQLGGITTTETTNRIRIEKPLSPTAQTVVAPIVAYYGPNTGTAMTYTNTGRFDIADKNGGEWGGMLMDTDKIIGLYAGDISAMYDTYNSGGVDYWQNRFDFGMALKIRPAGYWSDPTTKTSLAGSYTFTWKGDWWNDEGSGSGTELPNHSVMIGRLKFTNDAAVPNGGTVEGYATQCQRGETVIEDMSVMTWTVSTVNLGATPTGTANIDYYTTDIIKLFDNVRQTYAAYLLIGWDGKTLSPYQPSGTPGAPNSERGLGLAVKQD